MCMQTGDSCQWTNDSQRLILSNFESIRDSPTNLYHYVFPFCPSSSWLHKLYPADSLRVVKVIRGRPNKWGTCTREVPFDRDPEALAHRKDIIAVGLVSGKIVILDAITGSSGAVLSGHSESVTSLAFSIDGTLLVSGSLDGTIKLWDIQTGGVVKTIYALASSVSISPDATTISSGSTCSISLWDVKTGERRHIIDTATAADGVTCLNFPSATLGRLVSVSGGLVQQWDVSGNSTGPITSGHHIDFSSDGKRFVLCDKGPPTIRDTLSGQIIATLHSPGLDFSRCSFSPSDEFVAGVVHATIYVWNVAGAPRLVGTFTPHGSSIFSLVYAFSLISMHSDGKIRFRRIDGHSPDSTTSNAESTGRPRAKIMYTALQGEDGFAISVDLAGTIERWDLSTGLPEVLLQTPEKEDAIGVRLVNGIVIIVHRDHSFDSGWGVSKWDSEAGERLERKPLSGELSILDPTLDRDVGISKDGTTFYVVDSVYIRTWSVLTGENTGSLYHRNHTRTQTPLSINLEGPIIWIRSLGSPKAWGCDLNNLGSPPLGLSDLPSTLRLACLLGAGGARANTGQSRIIDTTSMKEVFRLPERFADPGKAVWDGRYLLVAYDNVELLILDFVHMALL
ncbi:WD40-repeat-containing domain protein [Thelephora terrestris]|uniref:WD40-repeat-containing domain protein n=1 Tax=Thelephora terrestris TaxID=56493 RepID=A0A9P6L7J5_9AGAM|nr:WD40-repeat-containing domain protein [Thelephora terrestris]